jgi:hypothetical protein
LASTAAFVKLILCYLFKRNNPAIDNTMPSNRGHDADSLKKKMPTTAINEAPFAFIHLMWCLNLANGYWQSFQRSRKWARLNPGKPIEIPIGEQAEGWIDGCHDVRGTSGKLSA